MDPSTVTFGDDPAAWQAHSTLLTAARTDGVDVERIDLHDPDGVTALREALDAAGSLFGGARTVDLRGLDTLDKAAARDLADRTAGSATTVYGFHPGPLPRPVTTALQDAFTLARHDPPRANQLPGHIRSLAAERGVSIDGRAAALAARRCGHQLDRLAVLFDTLATAGLTRLDERQLTLLLGTTEPPGAVWSVTDAVERGDIALAITTATSADPQPALVWAARRAVHLAHAAELAAVGEPTDRLDLPDWQRRKVVAAAGADPARRYDGLLATVRACASARGTIDAADALVGLAAGEARRSR